MQTLTPKQKLVLRITKRHTLPNGMIDWDTAYKRSSRMSALFPERIQAQLQASYMRKQGMLPPIARQTASAAVSDKSTGLVVVTKTQQPRRKYRKRKTTATQRNGHSTELPSLADLVPKLVNAYLVEALEAMLEKARAL